MIILEFRITRFLHIPNTDFWEQRKKDYKKRYRLYSDILYDLNTMCSTNYRIYEILINDEWYIITKDNINHIMRILPCIEY